MRKFAAAALTIVLAACQDSPTTPSVRSTMQTALEAREPYIVVFRKEASDVSALAVALVGAHSGELHHTYRSAIHGFSAHLPPSEIESLRQHPDVVLIERDARIQVTVTQSPAVWGLDRIDQTALPLNGAYTYTGTGAGVNVYIIDTGIRSTHSDFGGRASGAFSALAGGTADCHGHGTHVAGTVGGAKWGVAKEARLYGVRVLGCDGSGFVSDAISGIDWVTANAIKPAVANLSLGAAPSPSLDLAVQNSIAAGITYAVSAGNGNADACSYSPSRVANAITVGATTINDYRAAFSNFGGCLDVFAPGVGVTSAWATSDDASAVLDGTSMASPHVAGVAALYLQSNPSALPAAVASAISSTATTGRVSDPGNGSANRLLFSGSQPTNAPPVANFTASCQGLSCSLDGSSSTDDGGIVQYDWSMPGATPSTATGVTASASYSTGGEKSITLTVTDNAGLTNSVTKTVTVAAAPVDNAPVANFTWSCQGLTCTLDASSSTADGTIVQYSWNLGRSPNPTATGQVVSATYAHEGQRTVTLTVTDNGGKTGTITKVITVGGAPHHLRTIGRSRALRPAAISSHVG